MKKNRSTWEYVKKDMKDFLNPWTWGMALATMIIAGTISYFTGWKVDDIIVWMFAILIGGSLMLLGATLIKNKIKKGKWIDEN